MIGDIYLTKSTTDPVVVPITVVRNNPDYLVAFSHLTKRNTIIPIQLLDKVLISIEDEDFTQLLINRIKNALKELGCNITEANRINGSKGSNIKLSSLIGEEALNYKFIIKIANAYKIPIEHLLSTTEKSPYDY